MAKTAKKVDQTKNKEKKSENIQLRKQSCFVNLVRMTDKEYEFYSKSDKIIVKNFNIRITPKDQNIHLNLKQRLSEVVLECCEEVSSGEITIRRETRQKLKADVADSLGSKKKCCLAPKTASKAFAKSLNDVIAECWRKCKKEFHTTDQAFKIGDLVLAKMTGYSPWASRIEGFTANKKRARMLFFGTNDRGTVDVAEIIPFDKGYEVIRLLLLRKISSFHKSIVEIESLLGVPSELSLLKEVLMIDE